MLAQAIAKKSISCKVCLGLTAVLIGVAVCAFAGTGLIDGWLVRKDHQQLNSAAGITQEDLLAGAQREGKLVWHANPMLFNDMVIAEFQKRYPAIKVAKAYLGGSQLIQRFEAEKERGSEIVDCLTSGLVEAYPDLRNKGYLARLDNLPNWEQRPGWSKDPKGHYFYYSSFKYGIAYNTEQVPEKEAPASFAELATPKWKGKIVIYDLTAGVGISLYRYFAQQPGLGFEWLRRLRENQPFFATTSGQMDEMVGNGMRSLSIARDTQAKEARKKGAPVAFRQAKEGFFLNLQPVAINKKAPHPYAARLFLNWLMSDEAQERFSKEEVGLPQKGGKDSLEAAGGWTLDAETVTPQQTKEFMKRLTAWKGG